MPDMRWNFWAVTAGALCAVQPALAEDDSPWSIEAEVEIGVEANIASDDPDAEVSDVFLSVEVEAEFELSERITLFSELTLESVTDAEEDRAFRDLGLYVGELGLAFDLNPVTLSLGKISPAFGSAWDTAPGYFGADLAEEYELEEMIGVSAEVELGDAALTLSAFFQDDTAAQRQLGHAAWAQFCGGRRGRQYRQAEQFRVAI